MLHDMNSFKERRKCTGIIRLFPHQASLDQRKTTRQSYYVHFKQSLHLLTCTHLYDMYTLINTEPSIISRFQQHPRYDFLRNAWSRRSPLLANLKFESVSKKYKWDIFVQVAWLDTGLERSKTSTGSSDDVCRPLHQNLLLVLMTPSVWSPNHTLLRVWENSLRPFSQVCSHSPSGVLTPTTCAYACTCEYTQTDKLCMISICSRWEKLMYECIRCVHIRYVHTRYVNGDLVGLANWYTYIHICIYMICYTNRHICMHGYI